MKDASTEKTPVACINPYARVAWDTAKQVKSMSHWHIKKQEAFEFAIKEGFLHIAPSNYQPSVPTYPIEKFFANIPSGVIGCPNSEKIYTTNTGGSIHFNALGSFADGYGHNPEERANLTTWQVAFDRIFSELQFECGGGITLNHPNYYKELVGDCFGTLLEMLDYDDRVLGVEIYNGGFGMGNPGKDLPKIHDTRYIDTWDAILATGRRCFGFAVVDWYNPEKNVGANILLVPALTEEDCLKAYRNGEFYMQVKDSGIRFENISYEDGRVSVSVNKDADIVFVTQDGRIKTVKGKSATYTPTVDDVYVRVEATYREDAEAKIFSNPFLFRLR